MNTTITATYRADAGRMPPVQGIIYELGLYVTPALNRRFALLVLDRHGYCTRITWPAAPKRGRSLAKFYRHHLNTAERAPVEVCQSAAGYPEVLGLTFAKKAYGGVVDLLS
jgi:hypothetical protein